MLDYEWGSSPSQALLPSSSTDSPAATPHHHHHSLDPFSAPTPPFPPPHPNFPFYPLDQITNHTHFQSYPPPMDYDSAAAGFMMVPKSEPATGSVANTQSRIGLNLGLGGRTYFSAADEGFISRLYRRSRGFEGGSMAASTPRCQAEGCNADLTHAKHYHRRHKVCDFHSKASAVVAAGITQRFCQQCSRFHVLTEFDNGKRSCRRRLADHNRRRRKSHQLPATIHDRRPSPSENLPRSPPNFSAAQEAAVSPATVSLDALRPVQESCYNSSAASSSVSTSSNSMFY